MTVIRKIFEIASVEKAGFDPTLAVRRLSRRLSPTRVEASCALALQGPMRAPLRKLRPTLDIWRDKTGHVPDNPGADDGGYVRGSAYYVGGTR